MSAEPAAPAHDAAMSVLELGVFAAGAALAAVLLLAGAEWTPRRR